MPRLSEVYVEVYTTVSKTSMAMTTIKVGVCEFRERIAGFLESEPVARTCALQVRSTSVQALTSSPN